MAGGRVLRSGARALCPLLLDGVGGSSPSSSLACAGGGGRRAIALVRHICFVCCLRWSSHANTLCHAGCSSPSSCASGACHYPCPPCGACNYPSQHPLLAQYHSRQRQPCALPQIATASQHHLPVPRLRCADYSKMVFCDHTNNFCVHDLSTAPNLNADGDDGRLRAQHLREHSNYFGAHCTFTHGAYHSHTCPLSSQVCDDCLKTGAQVHPHLPTQVQTPSVSIYNRLLVSLCSQITPKSAPASVFLEPCYVPALIGWPTGGWPAYCHAGCC